MSTRPLNRSNFLVELYLALCGQTAANIFILASPNPPSQSHHIEILASPTSLTFFFVFFLGPNPQHIWRFPGWDPIRAIVTGLCHSHSQHQIWATSATYTTAHSIGQILNPLRKARDGTCVLMNASQIYFHWWDMMGTSPLTFFFSTQWLCSHCSIYL